MQAYTGEVFPLPDEVEVGEKVSLEKLPHLDPTTELALALERGEPVVAVSAAVAHRVRLGERELQRRRRRKR